MNLKSFIFVKLSHRLCEEKGYFQCSTSVTIDKTTIPGSSGGSDVSLV